jgi:hypothetical protein
MTLRPDTLRRMVAEWIAKGATVTIREGEIIVTPQPQKQDAFDMVDMKR